MPSDVDAHEPTARPVALDLPSKSERRHRHLHRRALEKLANRPELRLRCLALVDNWIARPEYGHARPWLDEWRRMLAEWSIDRIVAVVLDPEQGQTLRRCSPLGPALTPVERWTAFAEVTGDIERGGANPPA